jgi:antitoxin VapB
MLTRVFKSGDSLAVRIPKELTSPETVQDVEIEHIGNTLTTRPVERQTLSDLGTILAMFSPHFIAEGPEFHAKREHDWDPPAPARQDAPGD